MKLALPAPANGEGQPKKPHQSPRGWGFFTEKGMTLMPLKPWTTTTLDSMTGVI
tara:strand:- start:2 stop:163 length:162 start_codon:yes stop_codon:yes gene_type:complete